MFNITDLQQKMELKITYLEHIMGKRSQVFVHAPLIISNDIDLAIYDLNTGLGWDGYHADHFKFYGNIFRNVFGKFLYKLLDHYYIPVCDLIISNLFFGKMLAAC